VQSVSQISCCEELKTAALLVTLLTPLEERFMPRTAEIYQIFIASPSDVEEERNLTKSVIDELNKTIASDHNIVLELLRWETDSFPNFGDDPQDVINSQIGQNCDVFVGILWSRFGTPTNRASSGTEEEFLNVFQRWRRDPKSVTIMFYFKDAPIEPSKINLEQISKVIEFKKNDRERRWSLSSI
jgi:hypothetical protein